jgi:hypothetical protein
MNSMASKLSKTQHEALVSLAAEPEMALYGFAVRPCGVSRPTMRALLGKGMVSIARSYEGVAHEYISGHFGRIAHTRRVEYTDIRYSLTEAGRAAING